MNVKKDVVLTQPWTDAQLTLSSSVLSYAYQWLFYGDKLAVSLS
jgi:hypothetical protein